MQKRALWPLWLLLGGVIYYLWVSATGIGIPCLWRMATGLKCPGCGITSALIVLSRGQFGLAFSYNMGLWLLSPLLAGYLGYYALCRIRGWEPSPRIVSTGGALLLAALILWGIIRNLLCL